MCKHGGRKVDILRCHQLAWSDACRSIRGVPCHGSHRLILTTTYIYNVVVKMLLYRMVVRHPMDLLFFWFLLCRMESSNRIIALTDLRWMVGLATLFSLMVLVLALVLVVGYSNFPSKGGVSKSTFFCDTQPWSGDLAKREQTSTISCNFLQVPASSYEFCANSRIKGS